LAVNGFERLAKFPRLRFAAPWTNLPAFLLIPLSSSVAVQHVVGCARYGFGDSDY
jgi:hypothetical protein